MILRNNRSQPYHFQWRHWHGILLHDSRSQRYQLQWRHSDAMILLHNRSLPYQLPYLIYSILSLEDGEEDVRSCWMTLRTGEDTLIWRRRLWIALCGGIVLEEALDLSSDRLLNNNNTKTTQLNNLFLFQIQIYHEVQYTFQVIASTTVFRNCSTYQDSWHILKYCSFTCSQVNIFITMHA